MMEAKYSIHAKNNEEKNKIVEGLINSGYIVGVQKDSKIDTYTVDIYNRQIEHNRIYEDCKCQKN